MRACARPVGCRLNPVCRAAKEIVPAGFTTASAIEHQRRNTVYITTGCKALDDLLEGMAAGNTTR